MKKIFIAILCIFLFVACKKVDSDGEMRKQETYSLISLDSKKTIFNGTHDLLSINSNKPYLLIFLSTWCDYCLGQAEHLENINKEFGDKVNIYGIFVDKDEDLETLKKFVDNSNTTFTWFYKGDILKLVDTYSIKTFPFILLYNKNGKLIMSYDGITPEEMISFNIQKNL